MAFLMIVKTYTEDPPVFTYIPLKCEKYNSNRLNCIDTNYRVLLLVYDLAI